MQKRMVRKLDLEMALSKVTPHPKPKVHLEQYTIPSDVAAEILYTAAYIYDDIIDKTIIDLGCGTGRLAIGASLLGAKEVVGVDIDKTAIKRAKENEKKLGLKEKIGWIIADIDAIRGNFDTVVQNPPFGVQKRKADRKFLEKALQIGTRIYSLHKGMKTVKKRSHHPTPASTMPSSFLEKFIEKNNGVIRAVYALQMSIPHIFEFHRKRKRQFIVNLYVIERGKSSKKRKLTQEQKVY